MKAIESNGAGENLPAILPGHAIDFGHLSAETAINLTSAGREYRLSARDVIKWVAPGAPVSEAVRLLIVSQNVNLNPMLKEIELLEIKGAWHIYVRKQGLIKVAQRYPEYDGHETGVVVQVKDLSQPPVDVPGCITPRGYLLQGGWAKVYRKGWGRPVYKRCALQNYQKSAGIWQDNPAVMIEKVALAQALRESFPIGEVYDESELPGVEREARVATEATESAAPVVRQVVQSVPVALPPADSSPSTVAPRAPLVATVTTVQAPDGPSIPILPEPDAIDVEAEPAREDLPCTVDQQVEINELAAAAGMSEAAHRAMLARRGKTAVAELTRAEALTIICKLIEKTGRKTFDPLADPKPAVKPATA